MKKILLAVILVLAISFFLSADVYIKSNVHTDAFSMMGKDQPAKDEVMEQWIGNNHADQYHRRQDHDHGHE